jgi:hypothetical protein
MINDNEITDLYTEIINALIQALQQQKTYSKSQLQCLQDIASTHRLGERDLVKNFILLDFERE